MSITRYNFNTGRWVNFEFKDDKNLQKAKKIETIANIFKNNQDTWLKVFNLMMVLSIASFLTIAVFCSILISNPNQFQIAPLYIPLGTGVGFLVLAWLSTKVENKNARKEVATYSWAASLVGEGELKDILKKIDSMERTRYNMRNSTIFSDGGYWNHNYEENFNQKEKDLILNALEITEYIDPKVPEGVCSQSVGATYCPCIPPCVVMKNVVA